MYTNPLDKFAVYSYVHLWVIGTNTAALTNLLNTESEVLDILSKSRTKDQGYREVKDGICVFINGAKDVDFSIDSLVFEGTAVGQSVSAGANTIPDITGQVVIVESQGVRFLNVLRQAYHDLRVLNVNAFHCIKTVFVGWRTTDQSAAPEYILTIPPIFAVINEMKMVVSHTGSIYTLQFQHVSNTALNPTAAQSGKGITLRMGGSVADELNNIAEQYSKHARDNAQTQQDPRIDVQPLRYRIFLDDTLAEVGSWSISEQKSVRTEAQGTNNPVSINGSVPIERIIETVMTACPKYREQLIAMTPESFTYKLVPTYLIHEDGTPEVVYRLTKYDVGAQYALNRQSWEQHKLPPIERFGPNDRVLVYDYIFTGKNTDVESFSLTIDEGLAFLKSVTRTDNVSTSVSVKQATADGVAQSRTSTYLSDEKPRGGDAGTVVYSSTAGPPAQTSHMSGKHHPGDPRKVQYDEIVASHNDWIAAKMAGILEIRGNPGFISAFALQPFDAISPSSVSSPNPVTQSTGSLYHDLPNIYINVMMPTSSTQANGSRYEPEFESYWYQGLWRIMSVRSVFDRGVFRTELGVMAWPATPATTVSAKISGVDGAKPPVEEKDQPPVAVSKTAKAAISPPAPTGNNNTFPLDTVSYTTKITKSFVFGDMLRTRHANWQRGENSPPTQEIVDNIVNTLNQLQFIEDQLGHSIQITSGYRNDQVNRAAGSRSNSSDHTRGMAVDFVCQGYGTPEAIVDAIMAMGIPYKQLIMERPPSSKTGWVHIAFSRVAANNTKKTSYWYGGSYIPYQRKGA